MKRISRTLLSLVLCLTVALSMCIIFTQPVSAASTVINGNPLAAPDINSKTAGTYIVDNYNNSKSKAYTFPVTLPSNGGTLLLTTPKSVVSSISVNNSSSTAGSTYSGDNVTRAYAIASGTTATLKMTVDRYTKVTFSLSCAPINRTVSANGSTFVLGAPANSSSAVSTFTFTAPGNGYVDITSYGGLDNSYYYSSYIAAPGFAGWEYLSSYTGYKTSMGVKAGNVYKVSVKNSSAIRTVRVSFGAVKETSAKTSKKKAAKIKRKKVNRGLVVAHAKKVHWYKIKNTKNRKMRLVVNATKMGNGGSYSSKLKITCYFPNKKKSYAYLSPGNSNTYTITYGKLGTKKAKKGTYYVKVQSIGAANGYYTLQWK